jgi:hypothetical protein
VFANTPTLVSPVLGAATGTSVTLTGAAPQVVLGANATTLGSVKLFGNTSGDLTLQPTAAAGTASVATFPARSGTVGYTSGALTSGNCAKFDASGNIVDNGAVCGGGGGTPGGSDTQVQFNDGGAFGGDAGLVYDKTADLLTTGRLKVGEGSGTDYSIVDAADVTTGIDFRSGVSIDFYSQGSAYFAVNFNGLQVKSSSAVAWSAGDPSSVAPDLFLNRGAAATLQFGSADAAAPAAQTLQVQSVVAGTSNTAGANWTFNGSRGTGTGAGGSLVFKVAPAGSTGTSQNALATALTIDSNKDVSMTGKLLGSGAPNGGAWISQSSTQGAEVLGPALFMTDGGNILASINRSGTNSFATTTNGLFTWGPTSTNANASGATTILSSPAAATLQLGSADAASPVAQTLQVQSVVAGTSNTAGANWTFQGSLSNGSGTSGDIIFKTGAANAASGSQNSAVTMLTLKGSATTTNNPGRILVAGQIESSGSVPTAAGSGGTCATGAIAGGANAGTVTLTAACAATDTVTLTFKTAAATGWSCFAMNRNTPANLMQETSTSTTTAVLAAAGTTSGATDVIQYDCTAY